jgi:hypothetical protein
MVGLPLRKDQAAPRPFLPKNKANDARFSDLLPGPKNALSDLDHSQTAIPRALCAKAKVRDRRPCA